MLLVSVTCWERGGTTSMTEIAVIVENVEVCAVSGGDVGVTYGVSCAWWCSGG